MKFITIIASILFLFSGLAFAQFAEEPSLLAPEGPKVDPIKTCRALVVETATLFGDTITEDSFSTMDPSEFTLTPEEFNVLSEKEQVELLNKITPLQTKVDAAFEELVDTREYFEGNPIYQIFYSEFYENIKKLINEFQDCKMDEEK